MCPSSGHGGGRWVRLKRALRTWRSQEIRPIVLLVPAALCLLLVFYCFPVLSALVLCAAGAWLYYNSGPHVWRYLDWRQVTGGAPGRRQRPAGHRRQREPGLRWTPSSLLLLMGSYLGKQEPPARAMGRGTRELKERLSRPNPAVPTPARRLSFRETPVISNRAFLSPRRRYPIHQPQYSMPGSLPTVYFDGYQKKCLLSPKSSLVRSPVTVKIARPDPNIARSPVLDNLLSPGPASPLVQCAPDPCAKETVLNAIRESRKRMNKDEEHGSSGGLENKRRRQASSGSLDASFEHPLPNGTLPSYVSKPDNLKRGLHSQVLEDHVNKRSRTSSISSLSSSVMNGMKMSSHNAITSSYSSSAVILQKRKRTPNVSAVSSSPSSRSQTPDLSAKKAREESCEASPSTPVRQDTEQTGRFNETPPKSSAVNSSSENGSGGARRKKVLLVYSGHSDQYPLPPPPLVGYSVTSKDFDSEKKASLQRLNKALEDAAGSAPITAAPSVTVANTLASSSLFNLPTTTAAVAPTLPTSTASSNPLLLSLAKMQNKEEVQAPAQSVNTNTPNEKVPTSSSSCSEPAILGLGNPLRQPSLSAPAVTESSINAPPLPSDTLKSSLLQILTKPLENDSQSGFKPIFPTSASTTPLSVSSTGPSTASNSVSSANTFKPIFGDQNSQPAPASSTFKAIFGDSTAQPPASSSPLTFQMNSASTAASSLFSGFGAKSTNTTLSTESTTKPSLAPPSSSSSTTNNFTASMFSSVATTASGSNPAAVNSFPASNAPSDSQAKPFVFGQTPTSQATLGLNMFSSTQSAPTTASQPHQPPLFGSNTSAFTATIGSNAPAYPTNSGTSAFNSISGSGIQAENPAQNSVGFGSSAAPSAFGTGTQPGFGSTSQPTFGANAQPAFGGSSAFAFGNATPVASKVPFGNMNSTQTNSTPATNLFGSKPFPYGENANSVPAFGTPNATPAQTLGFGNSLAQNSAITNQSTPLNFGTPGPAENKLAFGSQFGQNSSAGPLPFTTSTPALASPGSFGQGTPGSFSIGLISKPSGARQRVMARRQHQRKK
ncbi:PREDICTED: nuclear envelope pore membrane protein POM 121 [Nanorana parkeri]|uniref:nuclear envelope pore membrane protein POM 121 n=1 Tax=Nanorana parkeri TaxID=125878 RepID=UPI00085484E5|nr:PREDICTED: nuclear envelope pore membrane protein POM 121 [Nanorana parkeri]